MDIHPPKHTGFAVDVGKGVANISALNEVLIFEADARPANVYDRGESSIDDGCCTSTTFSKAVLKKRKRSLGLSKGELLSQDLNAIVALP